MLIFNPVILFCNSCRPSLLFLLHAPIIPVIFFQITFLTKYTHNNLYTDIYRTKLLVTVILNRSSSRLEVVVAEVATWLVPELASDSIAPLITAHYTWSVCYYACTLTYYSEYYLSSAYYSKMMPAYWAPAYPHCRCMKTLRPT